MKQFIRIFLAVLVGLSATAAHAVNIDETSVFARLNNYCDLKALILQSDDPYLKDFAGKKLEGADLSDCDLSEPSWSRISPAEEIGYRTRWLLDRALLLDGVDALRAAEKSDDQAARALLGYATREGRGVTKDEDESYRLLSRACAAGNPQACLEQTYSLYWGRGTTQDVAAALTAFKDMCEQGLGTACDRAGFIISRGEGGADKNLIEANIYFDKACKKFAGNGCTNLGHSYKTGSASPVYEARAIEAYQSGCQLGEGYACSVMWDMALKTMDSSALPSLTASLDRGCSLGSGSSCFKMGNIYNKGGYGISPNPAVAYYTMSLACKYGQSNGCYNQGSWLISGRGVTADSAKAIEVLRPLCEKDKPDYQACNNAGSAAYRGIGMDGPDYQLAADFYRKACYYSGMPAACSAVIDMLQDGETQPLQPNELDVLRLKMAE